MQFSGTLNKFAINNYHFPKLTEDIIETHGPATQYNMPHRILYKDLKITRSNKTTQPYI